MFQSTNSTAIVRRQTGNNRASLDTSRCLFRYRRRHRRRRRRHHRRRRRRRRRRNRRPRRYDIILVVVINSQRSQQWRYTPCCTDERCSGPQ